MKKMINPKMGKTIDEAIIFLVEKYSKTGHNPKPIILHSLNVAFYLLEYGYGLKIIQAAILHDLIEDSDVKIGEIKSKFGKEISRLVDSLTFKSDIEDKKKQYQELFTRTNQAGKGALIVKCADIFVNSLYINLVANKNKEVFLLNKIQYFLNLSKSKISKEAVWRDLKKRAQEEKERIMKKYKVNL